MKQHHARAFCLLLLLAATIVHAEPPPGYQLVWADEFNGTQLDTNRWAYRTGTRLFSLQKSENVIVTNGLLQLVLKKEKSGKTEYTAGGVISRERFQYGYYEARFRCPAGAGWHTSFWAMKYNTDVAQTNAVDFAQLVERGGTDNAANAMAQEIDICEQNSDAHQSYSAGVIDWSGRSGHRSKNFGRKYVHADADLSQDFHIWACEFTPGQVTFYLDGKITHQTDATQFPHGPQNIWLTSVAVLGSKPAKGKAMDETALPATADFDWVRFYQKKS